MKIVIRILCVVIVLASAAVWVYTLALPNELAPLFGLNPQTPLGLGSFRADTGGIFFITMVMVSLGLINKGNHWFAAAATVMLGCAIGRVTGIAMDGYSQQSLEPLIGELVLVAVLYTAYKKP
jgi:hypothetical protein